MATGPGWGDGEAHLRALDCVGTILDLRSGADRARALLVVCGYGAELVDAWAAGHVRFHRRDRSCQVCVWQRSDPDTPVLAQEREGPSPRDWWSPSRSRRHVYDLLACEHLAELPLVTDEATPSLLVLARGHPFGATESDRLAGLRPSLLLLERLVDALLPAEPVGSRPGPSQVPDAALTTREREVLALLGEGLLARSIAARLDVSERTVHKHLGNIYSKLDAHDRLLAVRRGESLGLIPATHAREHAAAGW